MGARGAALDDLWIDFGDGTYREILIIAIPGPYSEVSQDFFKNMTDKPVVHAEALISKAYSASSPKSLHWRSCGVVPGFRILMGCLVVTHLFPTLSGPIATGKRPRTPSPTDSSRTLRERLSLLT